MLIEENVWLDFIMILITLQYTLVNPGVTNLDLSDGYNSFLIPEQHLTLTEVDSNQYSSFNVMDADGLDLIII